MAKSIIQKEKRCFIHNCGATNIEDHHIFFGPLRKISEKHGFKVWLCAEHHRGQIGPHHNTDANLVLKRICQATFEINHSREEFMKIIGRNYLD